MQNPTLTLSEPEPAVAFSGKAAKKQLLETKECVDCELKGVDLFNSELPKANLFCTNLLGAIGRVVHVQRTNLHRSNLREINFHPLLINVDLRETDLREQI